MDSLKAWLISESLIKLLYYRIEQEEYSSRIYLAFSMYLNNKGYTGAAKLFKKYSDEELIHADKAREFLLDMGIQPMTPKLEMPEQNPLGLPDIINKTFEHEAEITRQCTDLYKAAAEEGNVMLMHLALWYCGEQQEEMGKAQNWVDKISIYGTEPLALLEIDEMMEEAAG